jgi:hypothetical protein
VKDFTYWRESIYAAKTPSDLKSIGDDLSQFQNQSGLFGDEEEKLTDARVDILRKHYSERMKKLVGEKI